ncbi:MAG: chemotaxis protein CheA, partial [Oscillospiraceae bacterium]
INVNLTKLDKLMDLVGEIVISESMITAIPTVNGIDMDNFSKATRELSKLTDELQEIVMSIRMVPISGAFQKMNRIVRDMSKKLDKEVVLNLVGEETEVDKTIVDSIGDPLMHLVRNAMDHGLEDKEGRIAAGKSEVGTVTLSAENTGGEILITVQDDGKGMDPVKILAKAKKAGLLTKSDSEYSKKEILQFLLMPGFSTKEVATEFSGRGVGMDVVKKNVEKVGGDVSIESELGKGSCVIFKIPLTLSIVKGMEVSVADSVFTIPINNIRQSFKATDTNIMLDSNMREIVMIRNEYYPVIKLHELYKIDTEVTDIKNGILILVEADDKAFCIYADSLIGEHQVVVKPIPLYLNRYNVKDYGIGGCAILGNGNITLILDVPSLGNNL